MNKSVEALFNRTTQGIKPGLEVITDLLQAMDNPHRQLAAIHVAGTNGKGSVCAMLESVLRASGFKTGLYTSPHLIDFSERFRINGISIAAEKLEAYIQTLEETADRVAEETAQRPATFFEISTAIAFQYFADENVDIAIIETGMGGRWDATNVIIPLISVITHIDIDHTNYLGDTIEAIAAEKAGIIKPGRPVVSAPQSEVVMAVLQQSGEPVLTVDGASCSVALQKPKERNAAGHRASIPCQRLKIETHSQSLSPINLPLLGACQRENCSVAVTALEVLADMLHFEPDFKKGLEAVEWRARFQPIETDPLVILDGAHNPSAARALVKTLRESYPKVQVGFILGFLDDKDTVEFLREIKPLVSKAWTLPVDAPRGTTAEHAAAQAHIAGFNAIPVDVSSARDAAREWASAEPGRLVCITGSLYLTQVLEKVS
jgi:dihydrofolate synthase/folylpolyglutamate synthase